ncbi:MAG: TFIIB-type zinc ribbon-containing protein [Clostridia bacterium]|nr:TFIIB-type zinc ribbon-containing protein [Clostridia bacterium]
MSSTMTFKCPCCGGYLEFHPSLQKFKCLYCGQVLSEEDLRDQSEQREAEAEEKQEAAYGERSMDNGGLKSYHCQMCGAEIVTTDTTAATRCYYCHSPVVLHDRLDDAFRPDGVIPFQLDKAAAEKQFTEFVKKKTFIDKGFFEGAQLEMFSGVYYPFWYCDVEGEAEFSGEGTRTSVSTTPRHVVTTTRYFRVERKARMSFRNLARKALTKADGKLSDGIHPFDCKDVKPYASGYLSGFLAEMRDVEESEAREEILSEVKDYARKLIKRNHSFNTLNGATSFEAKKTDARYVLLPTWVLTYKGGRDGVPYYYMMNGQTGRVCGKLPINMGKLLTWALGAGLLVFAILCAGGAFIW